MCDGQGFIQDFSMEVGGFRREKSGVWSAEES